MAIADRDHIPICMACGSRNIRAQGMADGLWVAGGEGVAWTCDDCHHLGQPFLMDARHGPAVGEAVGAQWDAEYADAAFAVEDDTWHGQDRPSLGRGQAIGFVTLGTFFLIPPVLGIETALAAGSLWGAVRTLVGMGWLAAIGAALLVVGLRRLRRPVASELPSLEPKRG